MTNSFIRKYDKGLLNKVKEKGYTVCPCARPCKGFLFTISKTVHALTDDDILEFLYEQETGKSNLIDCGTDKEMFLSNL